MSDPIRVLCTYEPRGEPPDDNLEGFSLGGTYWAQKRESERVGTFWRVWPDGESPGGYFETCGTRAFHRCFEVTEIDCGHRWTYSHFKAGVECEDCGEFRSDFA